LFKQHELKRASALIVVALVAFAGHARAQAQAQEPTRDMKKEARLWQELEGIAPGSVESFKQATEAMDKGDNETAARLYREVIKRAPSPKRLFVSTPTQAIRVSRCCSRSSRSNRTRSKIFAPPRSRLSESIRS
jgi:hypothetical protein